MADADLYRLQELPPEPLGGGSGQKRAFTLEFIGKAPTERFPYTIANEVVSAFIGTVLGFNIPVTIPHNVAGEPQALVLWMEPASRDQSGPPLTSRQLSEFVELHDDEIHGAIVLDLFLANSDRAFGPQRRNLGVDARGRLLLFDFGNSLFYRDRAHAGITAGVPRLQAVQSDIRNMFDKHEKDPNAYYFQLLRDPKLLEEWCSRLKQLPDYVIRNAVKRIPEDTEPPSASERGQLIEFLLRRRDYLQDQILGNLDLFPGLPR